MITAAQPVITIIPPDGREERLERRALTGSYRPYRPEDGGVLRTPLEKRRRRRRPDEPLRGRLVDFLS